MAYRPAVRMMLAPVKIQIRTYGKFEILEESVQTRLLLKFKLTVKQLGLKSLIAMNIQTRSIGAKVS